MPKTKAKSQVSKGEINDKPDSALWGFIALLPFGWIVLWININDRRSEVEQGLRTKESAIKSIDNYALGVIFLLVLTFLMRVIIRENSLPSGWHGIVVVNIVAIIILAISSLNNKHRINEIGEESDMGKGLEEDISDGVLSYDRYIAKVNQLKSRLESIDIDNPDDKEELLDLRNEINDFFEMCKDAEFDRVGKYKLYELKSEYYFVMGDRVHAKEYIEEAARIKHEENKRKK